MWCLLKSKRVAPRTGTQPDVSDRTPICCSYAAYVSVLNWPHGRRGTKIRGNISGTGGGGGGGRTRTTALLALGSLNLVKARIVSSTAVVRAKCSTLAIPLVARVMGPYKERDETNPALGTQDFRTRDVWTRFVEASPFLFLQSIAVPPLTEVSTCSSFRRDI